MLFEKQIYDYLRGMVSIPSVSNTPQEKEVSDYIAGCLERQPYFAKHPSLCGQCALEGDSLGRTVVYGLVRGKGAGTVVLTGHYDVVDTDEYGRFRALAYDMEAWKHIHGEELEALKSMLPQEARDDLASGEWLFGRGVNDMKGGLSIGLAIMDWFGQKVLEYPETTGNLLFAAVADEEAYSAGMRGAVSLFTGLRQEYGLTYDCLVDLEPSFNEGGKQQVYIGSVGKNMPAVLVQGAKAHVVECFHGLNAIGVLAEMFMATELAPEFSETFEGEHCPPPTWFNLRDRKYGYDVSVPLRAAGYMSMLGFSKTTSQVMERLKEMGRRSFASYMKRMESQEVLVRSGNILPKVDLEHCVLEYGELAEICRKKKGYGKWYQDLYGRIESDVRTGAMNYPQATLEMMDAMLTFSGITSPVMVISFAPPYYPAFHSDRLGETDRAGRTGGIQEGGIQEGGIQAGEGTRLYNLLQKAAEDTCGLCLGKRNYCCGISDLSYCGGPDREEMASYAVNAPLWGTMYRMDLDAMADFRVPSLLFGPIGKDAHQMSERVHARSLLEEVPVILQQFIEQMFANA